MRLRKEVPWMVGRSTTDASFFRCCRLLQLLIPGDIFFCDLSIALLWQNSYVQHANTGANHCAEFWARYIYRHHYNLPSLGSSMILLLQADVLELQFWKHSVSCPSSHGLLDICALQGQVTVRLAKKMSFRFRFKY